MRLLAQQPGLIRGYVRTAGGAVAMRVAAPPGVPPNQALVYANGSAIAHTVAGNMIQFTLPTSAARATDWAVTGPGG